MQRFLCCAVLLTSIWSWPSATLAEPASPMAKDFTGNIVWRKDLAYVTGGGRSRMLDLYAPKHVRGVPLIVWIHGGAFAFGSKEGFPVEPVPVHLLLEGYAVASINYRLSSEAVAPAPLEDCKAAIRYLRAHADEFGIDPNRIGVWGASAGGNLAALLGTTGEVRDFDVGENLGQSSRVQAVCDFFGPTDFLQMDAHRLPDGQVHNPPDSPESRLVGGPIQDNPDKVKRVNPITYVTKGAPPFLIVHGTMDRLVPFNQSQLLAGALETAGVPVQFHPVEGGGHGEYFGVDGGCGLYADPEVAPMVKAFFAAHLAPFSSETVTPASAAPPPGTAQPTPTPTLGDHLTEVLPDRRVTFRLLAPKATAVSVLIGLKSGVYEPSGTTATALTKGPNGLWTATLGPFEPNLYEYQFNLDGVLVPDPGNVLPKPQRHVDTSLLLIPGDPPDFLDVQTGAHGTVREETYYSTALGKNRQVLVYTPPTYERSRGPLPVLYLYHGIWDTRYSWVTEGRLAQILDNLLAEGKTVPMVVVVPETHALPVEPTPALTGDFNRDVAPYVTRNQRAADEELFHDLIPFVQAHYNVSADPRERAIAGLSLGGLQAIETGIVHLGYFGSIGAFSPAVLPQAFSAEFQNALKDAQGINGTLRFFDIITGDNDALVGKVNTAFDAELTRLGIRHGYTVVPGTHSMFVWRPALATFLQKVFKP